MTILGTDTTSGQAVELSGEGRRQGTYVVGINGTGKSTLLMNVALQDMDAGDGLCLLDPHGDLVEALLARVPPHRLDDVILFDPSDTDWPFGLNMFECADPTNPRVVDRVCSEVIVTLKKLFQEFWGPRMEDLIRHAVLTLMATPECTLLDMLPLLTDNQRRAEYVARNSDPVLRHYWEQAFPQNARTQGEWVSSTLNKIGRFLTNPLIRNIVAQPHSSFDFRQVMDTGKILLINLSKGNLGEDNSALLGSVLVGKVLIAALARADTPFDQRRPFHLIVDEYHSFATESFPTLQSEARKFGIDTIVAHQYRDQLDELNRGSTLNVGNFVIFRVTGRDARELATQFDNAPPRPSSRLESVAYRAGREGTYRTGAEKVLLPGPSRQFSDVEGETANYLCNTPNYRAYLKLINGRELIEHCIDANPMPSSPDPAKAARIKENSRRLAMPRVEVEARVGRLWSVEGQSAYEADDTELPHRNPGHN